MVMIKRDLMRGGARAGSGEDDTGRTLVRAADGDDYDWPGSRRADYMHDRIPL